MTDLPHRPLATLIAARAKGDDVDMHQLHQRAKYQQDLLRKDQASVRYRLLFLILLFIVGFATVGGKMAWIATSAPAETRSRTVVTSIIGQRADIVDRNGHILATNTRTQALYAMPQQLLNPKAAADALYALFPDLDHDRLTRQLTDPTRTFVWIKKRLSPEQRQAVHDIGEPGLLFGEREIRLYPNGRLAAHVLGGTRLGQQDVNAAEVIGVAGVEKHFDNILRDPALQGHALRLSIDLPAQAAMRDILADAMTFFNAKGAAAVLMDVYSGEIRSLVSLPDFDPNDRPPPPSRGQQEDSPLFNRAAQGVYELGSTFKSFTIASALESGRTTPETMIDTTTPLIWGRFKIHDHTKPPDEMTVSDVLVRSSNVGTARMAIDLGTPVQQALLKDLGLLDKLDIGLPEARIVRPLVPKRWSEISTITISYGHGLSTTPLHLVTAYASLANGGYKVKPTLRALEKPDARGEQVLSSQTTQDVLKMLRRVVNDTELGTASMAEVPGYQVGGKTGSADKPNPQGGYYDDRLIASFAAIFPIDQPKYALVVILDEPKIDALGEIRRTAGWTAAPSAAEVIARVAPILNLPPINDRTR